MPLLDSTSVATFVVAMTGDGGITVSQLTSGDLSSAVLNQLFAGQRDIPAVTKLIEAEIFKNLP